MANRPESDGDGDDDDLHRNIDDIDDLNADIFGDVRRLFPAENEAPPIAKPEGVAASAPASAFASPKTTTIAPDLDPNNAEDVRRLQHVGAKLAAADSTASVVSTGALGIANRPGRWLRDATETANASRDNGNGEGDNVDADEDAEADADAEAEAEATSRDEQFVYEEVAPKSGVTARRTLEAVAANHIPKHRCKAVASRQLAALRSAETALSAALRAAPKVTLDTPVHMYTAEVRRGQERVAAAKQLSEDVKTLVEQLDMALTCLKQVSCRSGRDGGVNQDQDRDRDGTSDAFGMTMPSPAMLRAALVDARTASARSARESIRAWQRVFEAIGNDAVDVQEKLAAAGSPALTLEDVLLRFRALNTIAVLDDDGGGGDAVMWLPESDETAWDGARRTLGIVCVACEGVPEALSQLVQTIQEHVVAQVRKMQVESQKEAERQLQHAIAAAETKCAEAQAMLEQHDRTSEMLRTHATNQQRDVAAATERAALGAAGGGGSERALSEQLEKTQRVLTQLQEMEEARKTLDDALKHAQDDAKRLRQQLAVLTAAGVVNVIESWQRTLRDAIAHCREMVTTAEASHARLRAKLYVSEEDAKDECPRHARSVARARAMLIRKFVDDCARRYRVYVSAHAHEESDVSHSGTTSAFGVEQAFRDFASAIDNYTWATLCTALSSMAGAATALEEPQHQTPQASMIPVYFTIKETSRVACP